jgi:hypothetical protein
MGARSRRKGAAFERWVANRFREVWPNAVRGVGQTQKGSTLCDVEGTPWNVECKVGQRPNIYAAIAQSEAAKDERPWLIVARKNSKGGGVASVDTVTMSVPDFLRLAKAYERADPMKPYDTLQAGRDAAAAEVERLLAVLDAHDYIEIGGSLIKLNRRIQ